VTYDRRQVHHRFKLPFFVVVVVSGTMMAGGGMLTGLYGLVVPGVVAVLLTVPPIWMIATGRGNPWWMRSPLDPALDEPDAVGARQPGGGSSARPESRAKWALVLAGSAGFVVIGVALIVIGAARSRWDEVFIGALSCVVFGACSFFALVLLRGFGRPDG
jgi:hypothetical protein